MTMNKFRSALPDLIGRTIRHIVVNKNDSVYEQVFLLFTDGTFYEFYGATISGARHLDKGGLEACRQNGNIPKYGRLEIIDAENSVLIEQPPPPAIPPPTSPEKLAEKWGNTADFWRG